MVEPWHRSFICPSSLQSAGETRRKCPSPLSETGRPAIKASLKKFISNRNYHFLPQKKTKWNKENGLRNPRWYVGDVNGDLYNLRWLEFDLKSSMGYNYSEHIQMNFGRAAESDPLGWPFAEAGEGGGRRGKMNYMGSVASCSFLRWNEKN